MKDHEIAKVVNELRDIAIRYHDTQQLRERIANVVVPLLKQPDHSGDGSDINQCDGCQSGAPINAHGNHQYRDGSLIGCTKVRYTVPQDSDERRDNFDVLIKQFATEYALDRTAAGGWIFENHNLFNFVYAALASNKAVPVPQDGVDAPERLYAGLDEPFSGGFLTTRNKVCESDVEYVRADVASSKAAHDGEYMTAYEQECQNTMVEGIKYWKDKYEEVLASSKAAAVAAGEPKQPCVHVDNPKGCYRVRCQLGNKCADDEMSIRAKAASAPIASPDGKINEPHHIRRPVAYVAPFDLDVLAPGHQESVKARLTRFPTRTRTVALYTTGHPAAAQPSRAEVLEQPIYQVGTHVVGGILWCDVDESTYQFRAAENRPTVRIVYPKADAQMAEEK